MKKYHMELYFAMQEILDEPVLVEENELPPQIEIEEDMPLNATDKAWMWKLC
jgi:hypothetical protein